MELLLGKLQHQQEILSKKTVTKQTQGDETPRPQKPSLDDSNILTPASDLSEKQKKEDIKLKREAIELSLLKKELDSARDQIARQKQELDESRVIKQSFDQAVGGPVSEAAMSPKLEHSGRAFSPSSSYAFVPRQNWNNGDDAPSEISGFSTGSSIWGKPAFQGDGAFSQQGGSISRWKHGSRNTTMPQMMTSPENDNYSAPHSPRRGGRGMGPVGGVNDFAPFSRGGFGQFNQHSYRNKGFDNFSGGSSQVDNLSIGGMNPGSALQAMNMYSTGYQPQPIGTPLSPTASEFSAAHSAVNPWNTPSSTSPGQTYVSPMEPINYRRLLDRTVTCNWKYIVDKIVCNNDQQASIFLQQKLKVGTVEQKYEIIEAIVAQAYPLMVNRFGNFLVQRCFEHGTPEQVISIANAIRGNTLSLSMDAFGCHVVQKAFDAVPEDYKAIMVHELLRRIPETVIHRYACHVWQKLFELRWSDSPPQIMKYVNEALRGMWHEVALGETGSLVVQNIFENCLEEDKRPCIDEVLHSIDIVSHGQFGNWCIQHICEHGLPADRSRAIDHILRYASEYSMDQFASKVVEKCLKIGGADFLERYLERVCEGRADRPRIPLIDSRCPIYLYLSAMLTLITVASDQYGNYLIQFILTHANPNHRDIVASHIR